MGLGLGLSGAGGGGSKGDKEKAHLSYGLLGLLPVIKMTDGDLNTLALGSDLTTLGLNLNSSKSLYSTFSSPWADGPSTTEPQ
jgi:CCR4-NOT transcription complex subunit 2